MNIANYIGAVIFIIGGVLSAFKFSFTYVGSGTLIAVAITLLADSNNQLPLVERLFLSLSLIALAIFLLLQQRKKDIRIKQTIDHLKSVPYYRQTKMIPESIIKDKAVLHFLSIDSSVKLIKDKGNTGEYLVSQVLHGFENDNFRIIHNVYIPKDDGTTAEIDILCVTSIGFLIIESKNYSGWIYGSNNRENWTQTIFGNQSHFYNPVWQNRNHIKSLSAYSGISTDTMTSIVVFSDECQLKSIPENKRDSIVIQLHDLKDLILFLLKNRPVIWQTEQVQLLYESMIDLTNPDNKTVAAVDCLVPGIGEIIGGSQREEDYDKLVARMKEMKLNLDDYGYYLDLRKYGTTVHSGFGLGFERLVMYVTGMSNIRDVIPYPRTVNNCDM